MTKVPRIVHPLEPAQFAATSAGMLRVLMREAIASDGECRIVLAGGRTPAAVYEVLCTLRDIEWSRVRVFIGDERCVPPDHADSNFAMIERTLLSRVAIPTGQVHRMRGEIDAATAAAEYDGIVAALGIPRFHVMLNGVGPDGHTASLFPGDAGITTEQRWSVAARAPAPFAVPQRITMSLRALNSTWHSVTLCTGDDKRTVRRMILCTEEGTPSLPASLLRGLRQTIWCVDPD